MPPPPPQYKDASDIHPIAYNLRLNANQKNQTQIEF